MKQFALTSKEPLSVLWGVVKQIHALHNGWRGEKAISWYVNQGSGMVPTGSFGLLGCLFPVSLAYSWILHLWAPSVLVFSGSLNKILHSLRCLNNKHLFLTVPETRSPRSSCQQIWFPGERSFSGLQMATFSWCPHMAEREGASPLALFL